MLKAEELSLLDGNIPRVNQVSLACFPGTVTALVGSNGAGKTSLLRLLAGEYKPDHGRLALNNYSLDEWKPKERAQMMAVLPQHSSLNFPFTVEEVVQLGRIPHNTGFKQDRHIVRQALAWVDAEYLASRNYPELSGGEKQRVQLARVLAQIWEPFSRDGSEENRVLLLDEPSSSFDIAHQQLLQKIVRDMAEQGVIVVMVVHDLNIAMQCADQLVMMTCGQIAAQGNPIELVTEALIESVFGIHVEVITHPQTGKPLVVA